LAYSRRNRSAACRIPMYSSSPKAKRVEFRPPDPSANPYLCFSALLLAGMDGIENRINPGEPLDRDIYDLSPEELKNVPSLPGSLEEALSALEEDHEFLLKGEVFTEDVIHTWIDYKRKNEVDAVRLRPHPYEFQLYYDIGARARCAAAGSQLARQEWGSPEAEALRRRPDRFPPHPPSDLRGTRRAPPARRASWLGR